MGRDWDAAAVAVGLLVVGTSLPAASLFATVLADGAVSRIEAPEGDLFAVVPLCLLALFLGMRNRRRLASTGLIMIATAGVIAALAAVLPRLTGARTTPDGALGRQRGHDRRRWGALAYLTWARRRVSGETEVLSWAVVAALLMTGRAVLRTWSLVDASALHGLGIGLGVCAAAIMLVNSARTLHTEIRQRIVDDELGRLLLVRNDRIDELEQAQRARLHDARSVVLGVKGASTLLARNAGARCDLDAILASGTRPAATLLEAEPRRDHARCSTFVSPAPGAHHSSPGRRQDPRLDRAHRRGRTLPAIPPRSLDNLLRNAARHAPGANVEITVRQVGDSVEVVVEDDGPGIRAADRTRMLLPGVRGADAPAGGDGLGLYNSVRAMSAQHGSMRIEGRQHGGTRIVLALPAAMRAAAGERIAS